MLENVFDSILASERAYDVLKPTASLYYANQNNLFSMLEKLLLKTNV